MDLEEEHPTSKSVEGEKGSETSNKMLPSDEIWADSHDEVAPEEPPKLVDTTENCFTDPAVAVFESLVEAVGSPPTVADPIRDETTKEVSSNSQSPASNTELVESTPVVTKGNGLRKWRRIKRDLKKDGGSSADSAQILKRRLQNTEPFKSEEENKLKSKAEADREDSVASLESRNADINPLPLGTGGLNLELERLASGGFSIGVDSDNSEDHNSKSSTATSAPRMRHEALSSGKDRGRLKIFCGKGTNRLGIQKVQQCRGGTVDANKKNKGDLARFEENSLSSVESDLRSAVAGVVQWGSVDGSNGNPNRRSLNFDEHSDEAHTGEEARSGYFKENGKAENLSREDLDAELLEENNQKSGNFQSSSDLDPLIESMGSLHEAEKALEKGPY
ncbi:WPP domain-interacting protein 1 [Dendrobium catenatum]|uniref:WPP domain-interacting protein 1 n=1 Tax=Dendrobium catenatum TaxID=906689 RepID=A0A2I0VUV8_9ASPA|nr:WPP domain-interacting protein 1 [Dendrobium catenatum]